MAAHVTRQGQLMVRATGTDGMRLDRVRCEAIDNARMAGGGLVDRRSVSGHGWKHYQEDVSNAAQVPVCSGEANALHRSRG